MPVISCPELLLGVLTGLTGLVGVPGNVCVLYLSVTNTNLHSQPHFWLIMQLGFADLIFCLDNWLLQSHQVITEFRNRTLCQTAGYIEYVSGLTSFLIVPAIAWNRFLVFRHRTNARFFGFRAVTLYGILTWLLSALIFLPYPLSDSLGPEELGLCGVQLKNHFLHGYWVAACAGPILLSYGSVLFCYSKIIGRLHSHRRSGLASATVRESRDLMQMMLWICTLPLFAQLPAVIFKVIAPLVTVETQWLSRVIVAPFPLTSACNPYIVMAIVKPYSRAFRRRFRSNATDSETPKQITVRLIPENPNEEDEIFL